MKETKTTHEKFLNPQRRFNNKDVQLISFSKKNEICFADYEYTECYLNILVQPFHQQNGNTNIFNREQVEKLVLEMV
jgi:hypothetical protein